MTCDLCFVPAVAVAISEMEIKVMVLRFLTGIKTKFSLQKKQSQKKKKKIEPAKKQTLQEMIEAARKREESQSCNRQKVK